MNLTIKQKLIINNGILIAAIIFLTAFSVVKLLNLGGHLQDTTGKVFCVTELNRIISNLEAISSNVALKAMTGADFDAKQMQKNVENNFIKCNKLIKNVSKNDVIPSLLDNYKKKYTIFISLINESSYLEASEFVNADLAKGLDSLKTITNARVIHSIKEVGDQNKKIKNNLTQSALLLVIIACIVTLIGILTSTYVIRSIVSGLKGIITVLKDIAEGEGDLTKRIAESKDELGKVAYWFNSFIDKIQKLIKQISENSDNLSSSSQNLNSASSKLKQRAGDMSSRSEIVTKATGDATENVNDISESSKIMAQSVSTIASSIEEMSATVNEISQNCHQEVEIATNADKQIQSTRKMMEKLDTSANEIGKIIEVINSLADKTNLLALNATIEAASAGDAGKGFAVVASEVKELAKQTAQATEEIRNQIENMQNNTKNSVIAIEQITQIIDDINTISQTISNAVEEQSSAINEVTRTMGETNENVGNVAMKVQKTSHDLTNISSNILEVNNSSRITLSGAKEAMEHSDNLADISGKLTNIVKQFKI